VHCQVLPLTISVQIIPVNRTSGLAQGVSTRSRTRPPLYQRVHALLIFFCSQGYQRDIRIELQNAWNRL